MLINKGNNFYISETTTATRNLGNKTNEYVAISDHLVSGSDFQNILKKGQEYSTLEAAYNAYEKLLTEDKYVEYKDTMPESKKLPVQTRNKIFPAGQGISFFTDYHTASLYTLWICIARYPVSVSSSLCPIHPSRFLQMSVATL